MYNQLQSTRRSFLLNAAQLSGALGLAEGIAPMFGAEPQNCAGPKTPIPVKWTPDNNPILPRLPASTLNAAEMAKLRSAYAALRNLAVTRPNDPRGWLQQGDKHCWNCGGGLDGQAGEEIHGSWLFLPWHRAFLYFHERILGALINDKNLRLAYWDWNNAAHRAVPPAWVTPNTSVNSLFDANRSAVAGSQVPNSLVGPAIMNPILAAPTFANFGGSSNAAGQLENGPHGAVHIWCGNTNLSSARVDMGLLDTAAQDPIFFAHHANIDRLWDVWLKAATTHKNPTDSAWLNHRFTFWDEKSRLVYITVADVINMSNNLRYTYGPQIIHFPFNLENPTFLRLTPDSNRNIILPDQVKSRITAANSVNQQRLTTLRVEGVTLPPNAKGIYRIVANKPSASAGEITEAPNDLNQTPAKSDSEEMQ
ncbi:MAG: tyrosinase family protein [Acidobacteriaceae bacterium]|nr:tyrosinase family protein [Acidobacteriaceae bacterium]